MSNCVAMHLGMQKVKNAFATTTTTTTPTPTSSSHAPLVPSAAKHHKVCDTTRVTPTTTTTTSVKRSLSARGCRSSKAAEAMEGIITRTPAAAAAAATTAAGPGGEGLLSKLCRKLRTKPKRLERCEKCGQKSDTCLPNPSFISGRKHFLCQDCRASSDNMKNMYSQLYRNLSLREARNAATSSSASSGCGGCGGGGSGGGGHSSGGDVTPPSSSSASTRVLRSRSMRTRPTCGPESGYETATSLDSTCSTGGGNGRLSPDPLSTSSGGEYGGRCISPADDQLCSSSSCCGGGGGSSFSPPPPPPPSATTGGRVPCLGDACGSRDKAAVCSSTHNNNNNNKWDVFGGAFKSEKDHLRQIQPRPKPKVYTRPHTQQQQQQQQNNVPTVPPPSYHQHQQQQQQQQHKAQQQHKRPQQQKDSPARYDGYLEIRTPNSHGVKYVFRQAEQRREGEEEGDRLAALNDEVQAEHLSRRRHTENLKMCYHCRNYRCVAFRAPFGNGWLCEECMDDLL